MSSALMTLKILLPFQIFTEQSGVLRIVAETTDGAYGFLPHRLDCVAALVPGILCYETEAEGKQYVAVDAGVLVKTGVEVFISVRRAVSGDDLSVLQSAVMNDFMSLDENEKSVRSVMAKIESGFLRRFMDLKHK